MVCVVTYVRRVEPLALVRLGIPRSDMRVLLR